MESPKTFNIVLNLMDSQHVANHSGRGEGFQSPSQKKYRFKYTKEG
jgi:hypothetical protein